MFVPGKVGINTEQGNEALTVHGNLQLTGQVFQPSDLRIKERIREVSPRKQLENVNQIRIVEFKYKEEFVDQLPEEQRTGKDILSKLHTDYSFSTRSKRNLKKKPVESKLLVAKVTLRSS